MGPNLYVTPPSTFTHFHQDGHGTVDSGHLCMSGFNEVVMLRRLTERHKQHALMILTGGFGAEEDGKKKEARPAYFDGLYSEPHGDLLVSNMISVSTCPPRVEISVNLYHASGGQTIMAYCSTD